MSLPLPVRRTVATKAVTATTAEFWTNRELIPMLMQMRAAVNSGTLQVNVVQFGADPTGVVDSARAVNNAIASMAALGTYGSLYFPPGSYSISSVIDLTGSFVRRIYGDDRASTTITCPVVTNLWTGASVTDLKIEGLTFVGEATQGTAAAQAAIHAAVYFTGSTERIHIERCRFTTWTTAIQMLDNIRDVVIEHSKFDTPLYHGVEGVPDTRIHNAYINIQGPAVCTQFAHCSGIHVQHNVFPGDALNNRGGTNIAPRAILMTNGMADSTITSNHFNGWEGNCIVIGGSAPSTYNVTKNVVVSWNIGRNIMTETSRLIFLFNSAIGCRIQHNFGETIAGDGIHLTESSTDNDVSHNTLWDTGRAVRDGYSVSHLGGIRSDGTSQPNYRNNIHHNSVQLGYSYGIYLANCSDATVAENDVYNCGADPTAGWSNGIHIDWDESSNCRYLKINGNKVKAVGAHGIYLHGDASESKITANTIQNASTLAAGTYDAIRLQQKTSGATTAGPNGTQVIGNKAWDDPAIGSSTFYGINVDDAVLGVDVYDNDCSSVQRSALGPLRVGAGSTVSRQSLRADTAGATLRLDTVDMPKDFIAGIQTLKVLSGTVYSPTTSNVIGTLAETKQIWYGDEDHRDTLGGIQLTLLARRAGRVTTTDASLTDIWSVAVPNDTITSVRLTTTAYRTGGTRATGAVGNAKSFTRHVTYQMVGAGTPTALGTSTIGTDDTDVGVDLTVAGILVQASVAAANTIKWQVQGAANLNLRWLVTVEVLAVNAASPIL